MYFGPLLIVILTLAGGWTGLGVAVGVLVVMAVIGGKAEGPSHARAVEKWKSTFRCNRCGAHFQPAPHDIAAIVEAASEIPTKRLFMTDHR